MTGGAAAFFADDGRLARAAPGFEYRSGQQQMAGAVEATLRDGGRLLVEAGTGTGKTLAYLVPALESGRRVIVSTGTRNLQDQIFCQDLPFLKERVGLDVSACLMKGRDNYLCRYRFAAFRKEPLLEAVEERVWLPTLERWSERTVSGDRAEIDDLPEKLRMWRDVNARADTCTGSRCPEYEHCHLTRIKRAAQQSRVIVVNHHLFFADLAVRTAFGQVLPDYDTVIFDEAHLIEEIATMFFGTSVSSYQIEELARELERDAQRRGSAAAGHAAALRDAAREMFAPLRERLVREQGRVRFEAAERGGPDLDEAHHALDEALGEVAAALRRPAGEDETAAALLRKSEELQVALEKVLDRSDPAFVYGLERRGRASVVMSAAPIDLSDLLREHLFDSLHACVLTSATLTVEERFDFFRSRLGLDEATPLSVGSPFDHARQAALYLPRGMPEPRDADFVPKAVEEIEALLEMSRGRAFLLFTSFANLEAVRRRLDEGGRWPLIVQGEGSKVALVERFKREEGSVLLGTTSFWHGVDVPGAALSLVVVDKLPYAVPSDPLVAARIERIRDDGGNPFVEYQTPLAVLELKQGLGRLLRRRSDRGLLAVLDPRLTTRRYGKSFLRSLPPFPVVHDREACRPFLAPAAERA